MQLRLLLACKDSHSGNSSPAFASEAGFIDFEGVADQRRWLVFDGFEIA